MSVPSIHCKKVWRFSAAEAARAMEERGAETRRLVLKALKCSLAPLPVADVASMAGISYDRARRALETLTAMHIVAVSGPKNNQRFSLTGMAMAVGGPASTESAAEGLAGSSASAAQPGSEAA